MKRLLIIWGTMLFFLGGCIDLIFLTKSCLAQTKPAAVSTQSYTTMQPNGLTLLFFSPFGKNRLQYSDINMHALEAIKDSPFDSYSLLLDKEDYKKLSNNINIVKNSNKKIWPRILFPNYLIDKPDKVMKIWDEKAVEEAFMYVKTALRVAKETGVEGILIDQELYRNSKNYMVSFVAANNNKSIDETICRLKELGGMVADCVHNEYRNQPAVLWFTFADLFRHLRDGYGRSGNYIIEGILNRTLEKNYKIKVVDGGELTIGYINQSLSMLKDKMAKQKVNLAPFIQKYQPHFELGATTVLFYDTSNTGNWSKYIDRIPKYKREIKTLKDYIPLLKHMFAHYRYVWIYWGGFPKYDEFDPESAKLYRPTIAAALAEMKKGRR